MAQPTTLRLISALLLSEYQTETARGNWRRASLGMASDQRRYTGRGPRASGNDRARLAEVMPDRRRSVASQWNIERTYPDLDALCSSDVDAVAIFTQRWMCRINEFRRVGQSGGRGVRLSLYGTEAAFEEQSDGAIWVTRDTRSKELGDVIPEM